MKYCSRCGKPIADDARFCGHCGQFVNPSYYREQPEQAPSGNDSIIDHINDYVGNNRPADLNWKILFTDVFKSHSVEEAEDIFICGTKSTTPNPDEVSKDWPHPWLYSRVFLMFVSAFMLLWICSNFFGNINALPGMIVVGAFTVPLSTLILFMEVNAWRNVSLYKILQTFLVGGCASLVATLLLFSLVGTQDLDFFGAIMTGVVEELGKAIIVLFFLKRLGKLSILTGLLVGASVGAGFAAFESSGYALQPLIAFFQNSGYYAAYGKELDPGMMLNAINEITFLRGFLAPGGHVTWAAISGAALVIAAKARRQIDLSLLVDNKFLRLFIIPVILHSVWDSPLSIIGSELYLVPISLTVFVWIVIFILINMGLSEVNEIHQ